MYYKSNVKPEKFIYEDFSDGIINVFLRTNIKELSENSYSYNEYNLLINKTTNIDEDIETNFEKYLIQGKANEDIKKKSQKIGSLEKKLNDTDYKVIKCAENFMLNSSLPYNFSTLLYDRMKWRNEINAIENDSLTGGLTIEQEKERKITEMMACCQSIIVGGIDYNDEHYSLNTTDQINLMSLSTVAQQGKSVPYHADGKICRIYTAEEMMGLAQAATQFITYHTTYFNLLKHQIMELEDISEIKQVKYGMSLKEEYQAIINNIVG